MCWACGNLNGADTHGSHATLTTSVLENAAKAVGTDIPGLVYGIARTLAASDFRPVAAVEPAHDAYAACHVVKASSERRYTLGLAYPAMRPDVSVARDGYRDFVSSDALEKTAWEWMAKHRDINLFHQGDTSGHATVVESYIWRGPDWTVQSPVDGSECTIKSGDWLLGTVWDEHGWGLVKSGLINGWSPEGGAKRAVPSAERLAQLRQ